MSSYITLGELFDALQVLTSKKDLSAQCPPAEKPCLRIYKENKFCYIVSRKRQIYRLKEIHQCVPVGKLTCSLFPQDLQVSFFHFYERVSLLHGVGRCQKKQNILIKDGQVVSIYSDFSTFIQRASRIKERVSIY